MQITKFKIILVGLLLSFTVSASGMAYARESIDTLLVATLDSASVADIDSLSLASIDSLSIADIDSLSLASIDSLSIADIDYLSLASIDSLSISGIDSLGISDSLGVVIDSTQVLTAKELRKFIRDSIRDVKDSIRWEKPRVLDTYAIPDSMQYKRIITWTSDPYFNSLTLHKMDTTFNDWNTEYTFFKEDINATYLGVIGSATQSFNYFKQRDFEVAPYFTPYMTYSYSPQDLPFYNTKAMYTELAYWGTLFSFREKEEASIRFLHTQNVTPALNFNFFYQKFGAMGLLKNEETDSRTLAVSGNYLGKRYVLNSGIIHNKVNRQENGGIQNSTMVTDTLVDGKTIDVNLQEASNKLVRNTFFINHSYGIPIRLRKNDSLSMGEGTTAYIGHYGEVSKFYKRYKDNIAISDEVGRSFYDDKFYINPTVSADSMGTFAIENRVFLRLQPWAKDAIISKIDGGIGHQYLKHYNFTPNSFLTDNKDVHQNNLYFYAGAGGQFRKYFAWEAFGKYSFAGYTQNDFNVDAKATFSFYPFKDKSEEVSLTAKFSTSLKRPGWYANNYYSNHYVWNNDFSKISKTKIEGELNIPKWKLSAFVGYSLIDNNVYYDTLGVIRQNTDLINVLSAYLKKDFKVWYFHLDHKVLFQLSSDQETLPLPTLSTNFRYYFQFDLVKNVLTAQIGADATYHTSYYAPAYNPALGVFQSQNKEKIGNSPYIDVFANFQWKEVTLFLKLTNAAQGKRGGDYFSAYHYIKPKRGFKIGVYWPFYIK